MIITVFFSINGVEGFTEDFEFSSQKEVDEFDFESQLSNNYDGEIDIDSYMDQDGNSWT